MFNILKKKTKKMVINKETKKEIEQLCDDYLKNICDKFDKKLKDGGGFFNSENFYDWNKDTFVINFFSISQDDFMSLNSSLFEKIAEELKIKIDTIIQVKETIIADDCPIIFFKLNIK